MEERIQAKLDACRPYYDGLLELRPRLVRSDADWVTWAAAERYLQLALECAIDVGEMMVSWKRLQRPEENKDVFLLLGQAGVLDPELAQRMARAAGLRNILVHRYGELDRERLKRNLLGDLKDLEAFAVEVRKALDRGSTT